MLLSPWICCCACSASSFVLYLMKKTSGFDGSTNCMNGGWRRWRMSKTKSIIISLTLNRLTGFLSEGFMTLTCWRWFWYLNVLIECWFLAEHINNCFLFSWRQYRNDLLFFTVCWCLNEDYFIVFTRAT